MESWIWAMLQHEGMEWWRVWWLGHHDTELCPLPGANQGAVLSPASAVSLLLRSSRYVGSILQSSAPSMSGFRTHRITMFGPLRGDIVRREMFSCVYWNTALQHLLRSCMHYIKKNNTITSLCNTQQVTIWYFLQAFLSKPLANLYFIPSLCKIMPWYWPEIFLVRIKQLAFILYF